MTLFRHYFDGITYQQVDENTFDTYVAVENEEGGVRELAFHWTRVRHRETGGSDE